MENKQTTQNGTAGAIRTARARALDVAYVGMAAAVLAVCSWISVPMPKPLVSFTMQTFAVALIAGLLGVRRGTAAVAVWLALGALGVPVFAGFNGGIAYMLGSTGGYLGLPALGADGGLPVPVGQGEAAPADSRYGGRAGTVLHLRYGVVHGGLRPHDGSCGTVYRAGLVRPALPCARRGQTGNGCSADSEGT